MKIYHYQNPNHSCDSYIAQTAYTIADHNYASVDINGNIISVNVQDWLYHVKKVDDIIVAHKDDGPAIICDEKVWFFYDGINYIIPDLPIDNETKLMLALKYSLRTNYNNGYATYYPQS